MDNWWNVDSADNSTSPTPPPLKDTEKKNYKNVEYYYQEFNILPSEIKCIGCSGNSINIIKHSGILYTTAAFLFGDYIHQKGIHHLNESSFGFFKVNYFKENRISIKSIEGGSGESWNSEHLIFLSNDGKVYTIGENNHGQSGCGLIKQVKKITFLKKLPKITSIHCGWCCSLFLSTKGKVFVCGNNEHGQLGLSGDISCIRTPSLLHFPILIKSISIGRTGCHTFFETYKIGEYYCCGMNNFGQIPQCCDDVDVISHQNIMKPIPFKMGYESVMKKTIKQVNVGGEHTLMLMNDLKVHAWGWNSSNQIGGACKSSNFEIKSISNLNVAWVQAESTVSFFVTKSGELYFIGSNYSDFVRDKKQQIGRNESNTSIEARKIDVNNVIAMHSGWNHFVFVTDKKEVYIAGNNKYGQLGNVRNVVTVLCKLTRKEMLNAHLNKLRERLLLFDIIIATKNG